MAEHHFYEPVTDVVGVGEGLAVVAFAEQLTGANLGFRHACKRWPDDQEPDGEFVKVVAPRLTNHTVSGSLDRITIRASILCPDCGLHGFVTDGRWSSC